MQKKNHLDYVLPAIYGLCVFLFFWKMFPYHLHFQEQFQLFQYTKNYFIETCSRPGGFCNYTGRFITQFFLSSFVGALLVSCLLTGIQQLVYAITKQFHKHPAALLFSFMPSLFYWYLLCDENTQTGGIVALLFTLITAFAGTFPKSHFARRIYLFASIPVLYWLAGGTVILSVILMIGFEWNSFRSEFNLSRKEKSKKKTSLVIRHLLLDIAAVCFASSLPFIAKYFLKQYMLSRYLWGVDYIHFVNYTPFTIIYLWILVILIVVVILLLPAMNKIRTSINYSIQIIALMVCIYFVIMKGAYPQNMMKEEIMKYDYLCRMRNWEKIIETANRKSPTIPMTVACLNLALYKNGQLPEKMFDYFQNGPEGLLPTFQRDFMIPTVGSEPYYFLGFVNTAQRFAFEAMEALPDNQKSARSIKRLAETNLINGYYETASKYIHILEHTLFYRKWAKYARTFLYDEAKIDAHPEWGEIRRFQIKTDFLFSNKEKDMMLGIFFQQNPDNRMAYEYLLAYALLAKDIRNFSAFFQLNKNFTYRQIPKSWQEALVYIWGLNNSDMDAIPFPVSSSVKREVVNYARIYTSMESPEPALQKQFSKTYWYYLHFRDVNQTNTDTPLQY